MQKAVVLLSGGLDSSTLLHYVSRRLGVPAIDALSFVYGQKHRRELEAARFQARAAGAASHRILDLSGFAALVRGGSALTDPEREVPDLAAIDEAERSQPPTYVPNRNMVLLAVAAAFAESIGAADVFYGAQAQDEYGYWDCTPEFVGTINAALALNRRNRIRVRAPFVNMTKSEVLKIGLEMGVDYAHTWTCYRGLEHPCGVCASCVERAAAFRGRGVRDPLEE